MPFSRSVSRAILRLSARRVPALFACVGLALATAGCGGEPPEETIDREAFVDAYVEIRSQALLRSQPALEGPAKDSVLRDLGVTEEELLTFTDVHGDDLEFMREIWADVSERLDSVVFRPLGSAESDSAGPR